MLWRKLVTAQARLMSPTSLRYEAPEGCAPLREALAEYLRTHRGLRCRPDQIVVTNGSQQALDVVSRVLINPGDRVAIEEPQYPGARDVFRAADEQAEHRLGQCRDKDLALDDPARRAQRRLPFRPGTSAASFSRARWRSQNAPRSARSARSPAGWRDRAVACPAGPRPARWRAKRRDVEKWPAGSRQIHPRWPRPCAPRATAEAGDGAGLPQFVEREFREFLTCGVFEAPTRTMLRE